MWIKIIGPLKQQTHLSELNWIYVKSQFNYEDKFTFFTTKSWFVIKI